MEGRYGLHDSFYFFARVFPVRMVSCDEPCREADVVASTFIERAEELFDRLANEDAVSSESAGLVVALVCLDVEVTEDQVVEATREILGPTVTQFSKEAFLRFFAAVAVAGMRHGRRHSAFSRRGRER